MELTAAGLFGTFTRFPFHPLLRIENAEQNAGKDRINEDYLKPFAHCPLSSNGQFFDFVLQVF